MRLVRLASLDGAYYKNMAAEHGYLYYRDEAQRHLKYAEHFLDVTSLATGVTLVCHRSVLEFVGDDHEAS